MGVFSVSRIAKKIAQSRFWRYQLHKIANAPAISPIYSIVDDRVEAALIRLAAWGLQPPYVIDIGAHVGEWTKMALPCFPNSRFHMIEAQPANRAALERVVGLDPERVDFSISMLGSKPAKNVSFFLAGTGSSMYRERTAFGTEEIQLEMRTLDDLLSERGMDGSDLLIKLDVQGSELDILAGAPRARAAAHAILLEVSLVRYNEGAPLVDDVIARMREWNFILFDIVSLRRIDEFLAQADFIFAPTGGTLTTLADQAVRRYGK